MELADQDAIQNENMITAVVLRMTPEITSENSIILNDLSAELIDFEGWLGESIVPIVTQVTQTTTRSPVNPIVPANAMTSRQMLLKTQEDCYGGAHPERRHHRDRWLDRRTDPGTDLRYPRLA